MVAPGSQESSEWGRKQTDSAHPCWEDPRQQPACPAKSQLYQSQKLESVGRLAGGIAHDFNNILSAILGTAELLLDGVPHEASMREDVEEISNATKRASELTHQLLAFSRRQVIEPKVVALDRIVKKLEPLLVRLLGEDVRLATAVSARRTTVRVDVTQMEQVIINLAVNARDAMPHGGDLCIEVAAPTADDAKGFAQGDETVVLLVRDQGTGMSSEIRDRIFEPFFTTKEVGHGSGLGLSMALGIVEQSGERIFVESTPGEGSCFRIVLPTVTERVSDDRSLHPPPKAGGGKTVLVVEDDPSVRKLVVRRLSRLGYRVLAASHGDEAIDLAEKHADAISLLLTDVVMPSMNGRELAQRLAATSPGMKVLYTSGYTRDVIAHHSVLDEGVQFIPKPYSVRALAEAVAKTLAAK